MTEECGADISVATAVANANPPAYSPPRGTGSDSNSSAVGGWTADPVISSDRYEEEHSSRHLDHLGWPESIMAHIAYRQHRRLRAKKKERDTPHHPRIRLGDMEWGALRQYPNIYHQSQELAMMEGDS